MLAWLIGKPRLRVTARELYGAVVAQSRQPFFYTACGVPDTAEGRFEVLALHLALLVNRLSEDGTAGGEIARHLAETFVTDMDDNLREMGVGDLSVPPKVKRAAAGLYERAAMYRTALGQEDVPHVLGDVLARHLLGSAAEPGQAEHLAIYVRATAQVIGSTPLAELLAGQISFGELP